MATFAPVSLNTPVVVIDYTATATTIIQIGIDTTNLEAGDTVNVKVADDTTGSLINFINDDLTENTSDPLTKSYMVILHDGDNLTVTMSQTAGTVKTLTVVYRDSLDA